MPSPPVLMDAILEFACDLIELAQCLIIITQSTDFITACTCELILELQHIKTRGQPQAKFFLFRFELRASEYRGSSSHFHPLTGRLEITHRLENLTRHRLLDF